MDSQRNTTVITAECFCKSHTFSLEVSTSKLPLECDVCHCDSCRHSTGALFAIKTTWPQPRESVDISGLQRYQFSANITYRFCGTCSTLMFYESVRYPSKLGVFYGPLKNIDIDLIKLTKHIYVYDTRDGGASFWLRKPNADGKEIPRYQQQVSEDEDEEIDWDWPDIPSLTLGLGPGKWPLPISCHCKGINLVLHRKYYFNKNREELPWFIDSTTNTPIAGFTMSDPCHPYSSNEIINWVIVDLGIISQRNGRAFPRTTAELKAAVDAGDSTIGTLTYCQPSSEIQRYFCKVCSASAFYTCSKRPKIVGVAMGLLDEWGRVRADEELSWNFGDISTSLDDATWGWRGRLIKRMQADAQEFIVSRQCCASTSSVAKD
ncbi:Mss4-like protein [Xylaria flabelliformis]|nr:Mss4-like protein [Xylaria flabelliformis]